MDNVKEIFERRWLFALIIIVIGISLSPLFVRMFPTYSGTAEILVVSAALRDTTVNDPDLPSILKSTELLSRVINRLGLNTSPGQLSSQIKTKLPAHSSILELSYKDTKSKRAADVVNTVADEAVRYYHEIAIGGYADIINDLNGRIAHTRTVIKDSDSRLQQASANSGFESSDRALDDLTSQLDDLQVQRSQLNTTLAADQAMLGSLERQREDIAPIVRGEILQRDPVYQQVQGGLGKDVADLVSERSSFRDNFPGLSALVARVKRERDQATQVAADAVRGGAGESSSETETVLDLERAKAAMTTDKERIRATNQQIVEEQDHLRRVADAGAEVGTLRAERDAAVQQYNALTQRLSAAEGDAAQATSLGNLVVVSRALPGGSDATKYYEAFILLSAGIAVGLAYLVDRLDKRFWGIRDMERVYGRPVLLSVGGPS